MFSQKGFISNIVWSLNWRFWTLLYKVLIKCDRYSREETIQGRKLLKNRRFLLRKLFKGGNYSRAETIRGNTVYAYVGVLWPWNKGARKVHLECRKCVDLGLRLSSKRIQKFYTILFNLLQFASTFYIGISYTKD